MIGVVGLVLLLAAGYYAFVLGMFGVGFLRTVRATQRRGDVEPSELPDVTVIVPARDEENSIGACIDSILACRYPSERLQIIIVDDESTDRTPEIVQEMISGLEGAGEPDLRLVHVPENSHRVRAHKKRAIEKAVAQASGDIILTTDADCVVPPEWIKAMIRSFDAPEVAFVSGPVRYSNSASVPMRMQAFDFFGLMISGAGGIGIGWPHLANGACVAYRRDVFLELGGFSGIDHVTSGDDELLMQKIAYQTPYDVRFCADPSALVVTDPVHTLRGFVHQRRRWASKGAHYPRRLVAMILGIGVFFGAFVISVLVLPFFPALLPFLGIALALKVIGELTLSLPGARHFGQMALFRTYPLYTLLNAFHYAFIGVAVGLGGGGYEWKGRTLDR